MVGDRILDDLEQLLLGVGGADRKSVEKLNHKPGKAFESTRYPDGRTDFDQNSFSGVYVNLKLAGLVDGRIEQGE